MSHLHIPGGVECLGAVLPCDGAPEPGRPTDVVIRPEHVRLTGENDPEAFARGAREAEKIALACGCRCALLKERSPSCGLGRVYDGTFTGTLTRGDGLCARLLSQRGLRVLGESQAEELLKSES